MAKQSAKQKAAAAEQKLAADKAFSLPQSASIPAGMKQMGGGYAPTWTPVEIGDHLHGVVSDLSKEVTLNKGTKKEHTSRVIEVTDMEGERVALWESAVLATLFDEIDAKEEDGIGIEIFVQYDGLGKKKPGQSPPKLFTVAMAE